jgi:hypothetical protein
VGEASLREDLPNWKNEVDPIISFCLIMSILTYFSLVGNLAHNATRLSLSNEPFLLNKIIGFPVFMMYLHFCCHFM